MRLSAAASGFVAVLVGFTSSVAIVFQAATACGATPTQIASWMWALGLGMGMGMGMGLCTLLPSLWWKKAVMVAWSTPGAAVLATAGAAGGFSPQDASSPALRFIATGHSLRGIPNALLVWAVVGTAAVLLLARTTFGRTVHAIGNRERAAYLSCARTRSVVMAAHVATPQSQPTGANPEDRISAKVYRFTRSIYNTSRPSRRGAESRP